MYTPKYELLSFATLPEQRKQIVLRALIEALIVADWNYILEHPETPSLYDAGIEYVLKVRPAGLDAWQDIPQCLALGSGDCLAAGSLVHVKEGLKPIEQVAVGDEVLTRGGLRKVEKAGLVRWDAPVAMLVTQNDSFVTATPDHRIWTANRDWAPLGDLSMKDEVLTVGIDGKQELTKVRNIIKGEPTAVYDLAVEGWPEFFVGNAAGQRVLVHNCKDFAAWRCAELRHQGYDDVIPFIKVSKHDDPNGREPPMTVYHVQVRIHDIIEDPSAILGMPTNITYDQLRGGQVSHVAQQQMAAGMFQTAGGIYMPNEYDSYPQY